MHCTHIVNACRLLPKLLILANTLLNTLVVVLDDLKGLRYIFYNHELLDG